MTVTDIRTLINHCQLSTDATLHVCTDWKVLSSLNIFAFQILFACV